MKRIFLAFLISLVGVAGSWYWLKPSEWASSTSTRTPIARILELTNEVTRQEEGKLLWSAVRQGDEIYLGDKIKTSGLSSTIIQFNESPSKLEIEENSMVVIAQNDKKLSLNMLEGRIFIQQQDGQENNLDLLSGGKKVQVRGDTAISVNRDGTSQVQSFGAENLFSDVRPGYSEEILSAKNQVTLSWKSLPRNEEVEVWIGESPLLLKKVEGAKSSFESGRMDVPFKPGLNYWQLITRTPDGEVKSALMKLHLKRPLGPTAVFPLDNDVVKTEQRPFDFKWVKGNTGDSVMVEVAQDQSFQQLMVNSEVKDQTYFSPVSSLPPGKYYWRVKSRFGANEWIESKVNSFTVHKGNELVSPILFMPQENSVFYLGKEGSNQITFQWRKQDKARAYRLKITGAGFFQEIPTADNSASFNLNKVGTYSWQVTSEGADGQESIHPVTRKFEIKDFGSMKWITSQKEFLFLETLPTIILRWENNSTSRSHLRISSTPDMREAESFQVQGKDFPYRVLRPGTYFARVASMDDSGSVAGESDVLEFKVSEAPLPPAPFLNKAGRIAASSKGDFLSPVMNARPGWLTIAQLTDVKGRVIDERRFSDDAIRFSGLLPGKYFLQTKFQDEYKRLGEVARVEVMVPEKSAVAAPKIKGIKVR